MPKSQKLQSRDLEARRGTFLDVSQRGTDAGVFGTALERRNTVKQKSDMQVCLDRESGRYLTGEVVKGYVSIVLMQEIRVKDLTIKFFGDGRVSWNERRSYIKGSSVTVSLKNTDIFLDQTNSILCKGSRNFSTRPTRKSTSSAPTTPEAEVEDTLLLPAGVHSFPFHYKLPSELPASTFDGRWGQVRYTIKAVLQRPWKFDIERERDFAVITAFDLNDEPELARPIGCLGEFSPGVCCIRNGQVTTELRIGRRGYAPGERISFHVEIENNSRHKLYNHRVALVQHVTFRASTKARKLTTCVGSLSRGEILPGASSIWTKDFLSVPIVPPTSNKNYRNIQIKYTFSLFICHSSWTEEFRLPVTVVIGTSGLKQETINNYLSILGYSGPTPKPSPPESRNVSTGELSGSANNSSTESSVKHLPRNSLTVPDDINLRLGLPSIQLSGRTSEWTGTSSLDHIQDLQMTRRKEMAKEATAFASRTRTSSCRIAN